MNPRDKATIAEAKASLFLERLLACDICPRNCRVNRLAGQRGYCGVGAQTLVYTAFLHQGEEPGISVSKGSGTIFFSGCTLRCVYCQNYKFSHHDEGRTIDENDLARIMLKLQANGADNINLVTPTHFLPYLLKALAIACNGGLSLPIIYNTSGYEKKEVIAQLQDIVDVYLVDMRYFTSGLAERYSAAPDYPFYNQQSVSEMYRQKPEVLWEKDRLQQGCVIRHLVLPGCMDESRSILTWIKENAPQALGSVMFQYQPYLKASQYPQINRGLTRDEYSEIVDFTQGLGLRGWIQDFNSQENLAGVYFESRLEEYLT